MSGSLPILLLLGVLLFIINQRFFRIADEESLIVLVSSLFVFTSMQIDVQWLTYFALWIALSPLGLFLSVQEIIKDNKNAEILVHAPFDHTEPKAALNAFLASVAIGERVYFAFNDPDNRYSNIFDSYRIVHELTLSVAADKEVHIFPDWYAVAETNFEGAPQCWGRSVREVVSNCERWNANFAIIYQETGSALDPRWSVDFDCISEFDWGDYLYLPRFKNLWQLSGSKSTPKWFLLKFKH